MSCKEEDGGTTELSGSPQERVSDDAAAGNDIDRV